MNRRLQMYAIVALSLSAAACGQVDTESTEALSITTPGSGDYTQVFGNASHGGIAGTELTGLHVAKTIVQDVDADAENATAGFLQVHESAPLVSGDFVVVPSKRGFTNRSNLGTVVYSTQVFRWSPSAGVQGAVLGLAWTADSTWRGVDAEVGSLGSYTNGYRAAFNAAIVDGTLIVPERAGKITRRDLATGAVLATIDPFAGGPLSGDNRVTISNAPSVAADGTVFLAAVAWPSTGSAPNVPPRDSFVIRIRPDNTTAVVSWSQIATPAIGVPSATDLCEYPFGTGGTAQPTGPNSQPPRFGCGPQRPGLNAPFAIDPESGHIVALSYSNNAAVTFLVEFDPTTLVGLRSYNAQGHLRHGCGVRIAIRPGSRCAVLTANGTTNLGADEFHNGAVRFIGADIMDNAPAIAPNGDRSIGGYDGGFSFGGNMDARGALVTFKSDGSLRAVNERFGWEVTPSVFQRPDGSFRYLQDDQLYSQLDLGVAVLTETMQIAGRGQVRLDFDANAIDFLDAHIPFDTSGTYYGVNGQGIMTKFAPSGALLEQVTLSNLDGSPRSMETLSGYFARDSRGRIYASYAGRVYVIEGGGIVLPLPGPSPTPTSPFPPGQRFDGAKGRMTEPPGTAPDDKG